MIGLGMNPFINSQGFSGMGMLTVALGAVVNIVLDPIFIFLLGMGVRGAALATVISQACSAVWVLCFLTGRRVILRLRPAALRLRWAGAADSGPGGLRLCHVHDQQPGAGAVQRLPPGIRRRPVRGCDDGDQLRPGGGLHAGAGHHQRLPAGAGLQLRRGEYGRVREGIRFTTVLTVGYSLAAWALVMAVPELLIRIFNSEADLIAAGIPAFRIYFAAFFCMSFQFIGQSVFVGLGRSKNAVFFSLLRKAFIVAP